MTLRDTTVERRGEGRCPRSPRRRENKYARNSA